MGASGRRREEKCCEAHLRKRIDCCEVLRACEEGSGRDCATG